MSDDDGAQGYERHAAAFMRRRNAAIGPSVVAQWAASLQPGAKVLELGCGHGVISQVLIEASVALQVVDASPTLLEAFRQRFPAVPTELAQAQTCRALEDTYNAIVSWGLLFLLAEGDQQVVLVRAAKALPVGGRLLFTAPEPCVQWQDSITELTSSSLGAAAYRGLLERAGLELRPGYFDQGENFYYDAIKINEG